MKKSELNADIVNETQSVTEQPVTAPMHHAMAENLVMNNSEKYPNIHSNLQYISSDYSLDKLKPVLNNFLQTRLVAKNEAYDWIEYCFALLEVFRLCQDDVSYGNITYDIIQPMLDDKAILNYSEQEKLPILLSAAVTISIHKSFLPRKEQSYYKEIHLTSSTAFKVARKLAPQNIPARDVMFLYSEIIIHFIDNVFEKNIPEASPFHAFLQKENDRFELYGHIISKVLLMPYYDDDNIYAATLYTSLMNIIAHFLSLHIDDVIRSKDIVYFCKNLQEAILDRIKILAINNDNELPEIVLGQQGTSTYHEGQTETHIKTNIKPEPEKYSYDNDKDKKTVFSVLFG